MTESIYTELTEEELSQVIGGGSLAYNVGYTVGKIVNIGVTAWSVASHFL